MNKDNPAVVPFLKWAGGKRWLTAAHSNIFPSHFKHYYEPFLGSGAVFFSILPSEATLSDINPELIACYSAVRDNWSSVKSHLEIHHEKHSKEYYYLVRQEKPRELAARAARFIYLNRTCWNALYRVNLKGEFNVPIGTKTNVLLDTDNFEEISNYLRRATIANLDFEKVIDRAEKDDLIFAETIPNLKTRVPAIKGKVASGQTFYSFSIDPHTLLKLSYVLHRNDVDQDSTKAYQRLVKKTRLDQIGKFIDNGGYFPNSIIINIQSDRPLKFDQGSHIEHDASTSFGVLHLPKIYKSAFIIDGQHRLLGYAKATNDSNHTIPVVAFHNMPEEEQTQDFVDINHTQKSVPTNLLHSIMADFHWGSSNDKLAIGALKTRLFTQMNADENSPFYHRIVLAEEGKTQDRSLTLQTVKSWGLGGNVKFFGKFKGDKLFVPGYLSDETHQKTLDKALEFFNAAFQIIENKAPSQWNAGSGDGGFIAMNIGVSATMRAIDSILEHLVFRKLDPHAHSGAELASKVAPYLEPIAAFVNNLDSDGLKKLRSLFGSGATEKVLREFQFAIHEQFEDFNPEGLEQWIKESSGQYNDKSHHLGHHLIEPFLHEFICDALIKEFGEKHWWAQGVPKKIQKDCSDIRIDQGSIEPEWRYLTTVSYSEIIKHNWNLLGQAMTEPGMESAAKDKRIGWLITFNSIRQKYSHPQRESVTESEYEYLEELWGWLQHISVPVGEVGRLLADA